MCWRCSLFEAGQQIRLLGRVRQGPPSRCEKIAQGTCHPEQCHLFRRQIYADWRVGSPSEYYLQSAGSY